MPTSTALVLETHNLKGAGADPERVTRSLTRLLEHLRPQLTPLTELVVTHDGPLAAYAPRIEAAAGRSVALVAIAPDDDYYAGKNLGFEATTADVVVFADADCWPDEAWLSNLVAPFADGAKVTAGRTTYREGVLGAAATTIDFMYFTEGTRWTKNFYANNVAFRRDVFEANPFPVGHDLYRGHCQLLGMQLAEAGVRIQFVPEARTVHRFPDRLRELVQLRFLRGRDLTQIAKPIVEAHTPLGGAFAAPIVWAGRAACSLASIGKQDMAEVPGVGGALVPAVVLGLSMLDGVGALGAGARVHARTRALGYHEDRDRLDGRLASRKARQHA